MSDFEMSFFKDISGAITGRIRGYRLYGNSILRHPFATYTGFV